MGRRYSHQANSQCTEWILSPAIYAHQPANNYNGIISKALNVETSVDFITIDFARAYNKVSHNLLLKTLQRRVIPF